MFGCGSCSVVLVSPERSLICETIKSVENKLYAWERWDVAGSLLEHSENSWEQRQASDVKQISLRLDLSLSESTVWLLHELSVNFSHYYEYAQRYAPFIEAEIETLAAEVNELIEEIHRDEEVQARAVASTQGDALSSEGPPAEFIGAKKRLNANVDLLVQLNSALVYAITQAFAGSVPIRRRFPNISQHSLLGTGTAWRAIQRTCSIVFDTFRDARFPEKLREELDPSGRETGWVKDTDEEKASELRLNTRVVHFSARSGFGESDAAITCPSQIIQVCDQPEWSLCTATHEILHAHVRELIAAIFLETLDGEHPKPTDESLSEAVEDYRRSLALKNASATQPPSRLQELRRGLIEYAVSYRSSVAKAKEKFGVESSDLDAEDTLEVLVTLPKDVGVMFRAFKRSSRLLEETVVHTLDLHYFFGGDATLFCDSLWNSWSIVPSIIEKLDWYILRTLLTLASTTKGDAYPRLDEAVRILSDSLNKVMRRRQGSVVAEEVLKKLNTGSTDIDGRRSTSPFFKWIDLLFPACLPLVDLTTKFLISGHLQREFRKLKGDTIDSEGHYPIDLPDFDAQGIANPIALIHDRLKIGLDSEGMRIINSEEIARRSAWLLLALSSERVPVAP